MHGGSSHLRLEKQNHEREAYSPLVLPASVRMLSYDFASRVSVHIINQKARKSFLSVRSIHSL